MKRLYLSRMAEISRLPQPIADHWEWQYEGSCRTMPSEMFFHPDGERGPRRRNRENAAKAVCASCPVIQQCRAHALAVQEPYGIWGGLSEDDRLAILHNVINKKPLRITRRGFLFSISVSAHLDHVNVRGHQHLVLHLLDAHKQLLLL
jgi:WhiB family redox-sensing transcriptional regulator